MSGPYLPAGLRRPSVLPRLFAGGTLILLVIGVPIWLVTAGGSPVAGLDPSVLWHAIATRRSGDPQEVAA